MPGPEAIPADSTIYALYDASVKSAETGLDEAPPTSTLFQASSPKVRSVDSTHNPTDRQTKITRAVFIISGHEPFQTAVQQS